MKSIKNLIVTVLLVVISYYIFSLYLNRSSLEATKVRTTEEVELKANNQQKGSASLPDALSAGHNAGNIEGNDLNTLPPDLEAAFKVSENSNSDELPDDLKAQLNAPPPELPEDLKRQLELPPQDLPEDLKAQLKASPPPLPDDIKAALQAPPRIATIEEVNGVQDTTDE